VPILAQDTKHVIGHVGLGDMKLLEMFPAQEKPDENVEIDWVDDLKFHIDNDHHLLSTFIFPAVEKQKKDPEDESSYKIYIKPLVKCCKHYCEKYKINEPNKKFKNSDIINLAKSVAEEQKNHILNGDYNNGLEKLSLFKKKAKNKKVKESSVSSLKIVNEAKILSPEEQIKVDRLQRYIDKLQNDIDSLETQLQGIRKKLNSSIKYELFSGLSEISQEVINLSKNAGIDEKEFEYHLRYISNAEEELTNTIWALEEPLVDRISDIKNRIDHYEGEIWELKYQYD
jgi:predicted transcriptional regulator